MKPFGKYLVEFGQIDNDKLLQGLVQQVKSTPSIAEVVFELNLLSIDQQLAILEEQTASNEGYVTCANKLGHWTDELATKVESAAFERKISLMDIILANGWATSKDLTSKLDEYLVEHEDDINYVDSKKTELVSKEDTTLEEKTGDTAKPGSPDQEPWNSLMEVFDDDRRQRLVLIAELVGDMTGESLKGTLENLYEDFEPIVNIDKISDLAKLSGLIESMKVAFTSFSSGDAVLAESLSSNFSTAFIEGVNFLWKILNASSESKSEETFFSNQDDLAALEDLTGKFAQLQNALCVAA